MWCTNSNNFYDNKDLSFTYALLLIYITAIFSAYNVSGRWVENLKNLWTGHFLQGQNPVKWGFAWQLHACCHIPPTPQTKKYNVEVVWFLPLHVQVEGHRRRRVLWVRRYNKTYFVQDSIATYAILKIITEGIFSWRHD